MSASFLLTLDTQPPADPTLVINGGAPFTGQTEVLVTLSTADYQAGHRDVKSVRLWGDVDPSADPSVQVAERDSAWQDFRENVVVRLSPGPGRKYIKARLVDDVCNETVEFCGFIDLDIALPVVEITTAVDRSRISKVAPCNTSLFVWQAHSDFVAFEVRVVPSVASPHTAGVRIPTMSGSSGTQGVGAFSGRTPMVTTVNGADLEAASPGDGAKHVKVFIRDREGRWSA